MKTMVSVLGTLLLAGAVALAQGSGAQSSAKKNSSSNSASSSSAVQAGNSGFDASESAQTPSAKSSTSSGQAGTSSAYSGSSNDSSVASRQSGPADAQSISNGPVAETVSDSSAVIGWATHSAASNTGVKYGMTRANLTETAQGTDGSDGKNHHARLHGLSASTRYYFQVTENGQPVGGVGTFKTTAAGETPVQSKAVIPEK